MIVLFVPPVVAGAEDVAAAINRAVRAAHADKPVLAVVISHDGIPTAFREPGAGVANFLYPESAARALGLAADRAEWLRRPAGDDAAPRPADTAGARATVREALATVNDVWLDAASTRSLLQAYGLPVVDERVAATADEAVAAATQLGYPVVIKTAVPGVHKTEHGGVALDLAAEGDVRAAVAAIGLPVLVQPFLASGAELLAGIVQDPVFGPLVAFGPGGVFAELIGDAGLRLAPLSELEAKELVLGGKAGRLVRGFRGSEPANAEALVELVVRLAQLAVELPEVAELDLNPVLADAKGCVAVDARIRLRSLSLQQSVKGW